MTRNSRLLRLVGIILVALAILLALYTVVGYVGWQSGQSLRTERIQEIRAKELTAQFSHAQEEVEEGNYRLAARRLEWILEQEPDFAEAQELQARIEQRLAQTRTPGATETPDAASVTATPPPAGTVSGGEENRPAAEELQRLERVMESQEWDSAVSGLIAFQSQFPDYERRRTDQLLYDAYIELGTEHLYGEQVELGLYYLSRAEQLGNLPETVLDQQQWAELYLAGIGYYGVNWNVALFYFRDLCLAAPFFHDSCQRLYEALLAYGDQYAVQQEWCPAEELYAEAYDIDSTSEVTQKLNQSRRACAEGTPTPGATITGTVPFNGEPTTTADS